MEAVTVTGVGVCPARQAAHWRRTEQASHGKRTF